MTQEVLDFTAQDEHLERVTARIAAAIIAWTRARVGQTFHMDELRRHLLGEVGMIAPASPDRILRDLRQRGKLKYEVLNRRESLYRVLEVA